ncbi:hypothetical protein M1293_02460 [Candidatus Parvarchaeota archaeon]|nr:hypothetical protein [Candidatus Parvarchaeota archaeon]
MAKKKKSKVRMSSKRKNKAHKSRKVRRERPQKINTKRLLALDEAVKYITDLSGEKGLEIFRYLIDHGTMEENTLAKKMKFKKANAIRKFLYKLYNKTLVSYIRKKKGSKAWYTYYWSANPDRLMFLLKKEYEDEIAQAKKSIELNKANDFYICNSCNRRYDLNSALENDFRCYNCGAPLSHMDLSEIVEDKDSRIRFLKEKIDALSRLVK